MCDDEDCTQIHVRSMIAPIMFNTINAAIFYYRGQVLLRTVALDLEARSTVLIGLLGAIVLGPDK